MHVDASVILTTWTMPQLLFTAIGIQEQQASNARQHFMLTMAAIGACFAKDGQRIVNQIMTALDGGPDMVEDVFEEISDQAKLVLFGHSQTEVLSGHETDSDQDSD